MICKCAQDRKRHREDLNLSSNNKRQKLIHVNVTVMLNDCDERGVTSNTTEPFNDGIEHNDNELNVSSFPFLSLPTDLQLHIFEKYLLVEDRGRLNIALSKQCNVVTQYKRASINKLGILMHAIRKGTISSLSKQNVAFLATVPDFDLSKQELVQKFGNLVPRFASKPELIFQLTEQNSLDEHYLARFNRLSLFDQRYRLCNSTPKIFDNMVKAGILENHKWYDLVFDTINSRNHVLMKHFSEIYGKNKITPDLFLEFLYGESECCRIILDCFQISGTDVDKMLSKQAHLMHDTNMYTDLLRVKARCT